MAGISGSLTSRLVTKLQAPVDGINVRIGAIQNGDGAIQTAHIRSIVAMNAAADIVEKAGHAHYPSVFTYCDKVSNKLQEKFRQFSGTARLVIEVRNSQDRIEGLEANTHLYIDAVCALLDDSRGQWDTASFYAGGYEVSYDPIGRGGKNFLQRAKVSFDVEVSK